MTRIQRVAREVLQDYDAEELGQWSASNLAELAEDAAENDEEIDLLKFALSEERARKILEARNRQAMLADGAKQIRKYISDLEKAYGKDAWKKDDAHEKLRDLLFD